MKQIATSQYDFAVLRENGCVYVDKTDILAKLAQRADAQYFIARPRRFGKSLMLSTFRYLFEGRRDLFKGLKIEKTKRGYADACVGEASSPPHAGAARRRTYGRRPVTLVGIKFDPVRRNIDVPRFEEL